MQPVRTDEQVAEQRRSLRRDRVAHVRVGHLPCAALEQARKGRVAVARHLVGRRADGNGKEHDRARPHVVGRGRVGQAGIDLCSKETNARQCEAM